MLARGGLRDVSAAAERAAESRWTEQRHVSPASEHRCPIRPASASHGDPIDARRLVGRHDVRGVRPLTAVLLAGLAAACGGKSDERHDEVGAVHDGKGLYELRIESSSDDCTPPLWSGDAGEVVVVVATGQGAEGLGSSANIPVYEVAPDPTFSASRSRRTPPTSTSSLLGPARVQPVVATLALTAAHAASFIFGGSGRALPTLEI